MESKQMSLVDSFFDENEVVTLVSDVELKDPKYQERKADLITAMKKRVKLAVTLANEMIKQEHSIENARDLLLAVDLWRKGDNGSRKKKDANIPVYKPFSKHLFQTIDRWYGRNVDFLS